MKEKVSLRAQLKEAVSVEGKVSKSKLFAKLILTLVASVWTLMFLGVTLSLGNPLIDYFESQDADDTTVSAVAVWFLFTVVVSAIYFVYRIYRGVLGEWTTKEINNSDEKTDSSEPK